MNTHYWGLKWWKSGEWQVIQERLRDLDKLGIRWNPDRNKMFKALQLIKPEDVKVVILGQDPYPKRSLCTGIAFDIPKDSEFTPATLVNIFEVYQEDLGYPEPSSGSLLPWVDRGVLLWNVYPTCSESASLSHHWDEYKFLTWEILDTLAEQCVVVVTLGGQAKQILRPKDWETFEILSYSHPSPLGKTKGASHFSAIWKDGEKVAESCRMFSSINAKLVEQGLEPIDWHLP